ncbi:MAG: dihydropteroate synthase, partial [Acidobacteria bacterium]|nr:dihydropteroate synthase [Acidobacteriota bacterium]
MGIVNVTPDSFSDGGVHFVGRFAVESALRMVGDGATIIDVGGESTRPGAEPVPVEEELSRVLPVIRAIRERSEVAISVDTMKAEVASEAIAAGADIINDVTALRHDPRMLEVAASSDVPLILMHMRGEPNTMQRYIHYDNLIGEVYGELEAWRDHAVKKG